MVHNHELRLRRHLRVRCGLPGTRRLAGRLEALARLRLLRGRQGRDGASPAGHRRKLLELAFAEHGSATSAIAPLRQRADDFIAKRLYQAAQLVQARGVGGVFDAWSLDADKDRARDGRFGLHKQGCSMRAGLQHGSHGKKLAAAARQGMNNPPSRRPAAINHRASLRDGFASLLWLACRVQRGIRSFFHSAVTPVFVPGSILIAPASRLWPPDQGRTNRDETGAVLNHIRRSDFEMSLRALNRTD